MRVWPAQDFGFRGDNYIMKTVRVVTFAHNIPTGPLLHFYQTLSKYVLGYESYSLHKISASMEITTQRIKWELSLLTRHAYWSSSSSLPNIIKLSQTVWELWPAQDFGFRGDNHIRKTVRVVSLARNTPTGTPLHSYQTLSKICLSVSKLWSAQGWVQFLLQGRSLIKWELSLLHETCLLVLLFIPTKYDQIISYGQQKISATGDLTI